MYRSKAYQEFNYERSVLNIMRFTQQQRFYCNFQLIESHCIHAVSLIEINTPELPLLNATLYEVTEDSIYTSSSRAIILYLCPFLLQTSAKPLASLRKLHEKTVGNTDVSSKIILRSYFGRLRLRNNYKLYYYKTKVRFSIL